MLRPSWIFESSWYSVPVVRLPLLLFLLNGNHLCYKLLALIIFRRYNDGSILVTRIECLVRHGLVLSELLLRGYLRINLLILLIRKSLVKREGESSAHVLIEKVSSRFGACILLSWIIVEIDSLVVS